MNPIGRLFGVFFCCICILGRAGAELPTPGTTGFTSSREIPLTAKELEPFQGCREDADCMPAHNGCCPTCPTRPDEGPVWIHKSKQDEFKSRFKKNCLCAQCVRVSPKMNWIPKCRNRKCTAEPLPESALSGAPACISL